MSINQPYLQLQVSIRQDDLSGLLKRWAFGRLLLAERKANGGKKLPDGRLAQLANAVSQHPSEIKNRMQFADQFPTEESVRALEGKSWHEVCRSVLGARNPRAPGRPVDPEPESDDAFDLAAPLRRRLASLAQEAIEAGRVQRYDSLADVIEALLNYVEGEGREGWLHPGVLA